jgi:hypothetical protein
VTTDYANTAYARDNRAKKAQALADTARRLGIRRTSLERGGGARGQVWREAGLARSPSLATWAVTLELLGPDPVPGPPALTCYVHPDRPAHLYLGGPLCDEECAPWRVAGRPRPAPPAESSFTALRDRRAAAIAADRKDQHR